MFSALYAVGDVDRRQTTERTRMHASMKRWSWTTITYLRPMLPCGVLCYVRAHRFSRCRLAPLPPRSSHIVEQIRMKYSFGRIRCSAGPSRTCSSVCARGFISYMCVIVCFFFLSSNKIICSSSLFNTDLLSREQTSIVTGDDGFALRSPGAKAPTQPISHATHSCITIHRRAVCCFENA